MSRNAPPGTPNAGTDVARGGQNARQIACDVLRSLKRSGAFANHLLEERWAQLPADASDAVAHAERRLATEIVFGLVRRSATVKAILETYVQRPRHQVEHDLWIVLQIGVYQLVFLESIPVHAAVHETVELTRWLGKPRWSGFVNGVLRAVARDLTEERASRPTSNAIPLNGPEYRVTRRDLFSDPAREPVGYFASAFSFPRWLAERWHERMDLEELVRLGAWFNTPPQLCLRPNRLKTSCQELLELLQQQGIRGTRQLTTSVVWRSGAGSRTSSLGLRPERLGTESQATTCGPAVLDGAGAAAETQGELKPSECLWVDAPVAVSELPGFRDGLFTVQDSSAMHATELLAPQPGETILDLCAAPGTKTTATAEVMANRGQIVATDINAQRLAKVVENCQRLGIGIVTTQVIATDGHDVPPGPFDAVLVDVPCSNTGVLAKRPEARWRIRPADLDELASTQRRLLLIAISRVRGGGRIVYSTCSIEPEENQHVVRACLSQTRDIRLLTEVCHVPGRPADGGYQALLRRN